MIESRRLHPAAFPTALLLAAGVLTLLLGGCSGYQLGDSAAPPFRSIYVAPPVNASLAPQAAAPLGAQIIRELDRTGLVQIARGNSQADAELKVLITGLEREISADRSDDVGLARKWRVSLIAECTLLDRRTGEPFFTAREVSAFDEVYTDSGAIAAEYQNMPILTQRLAERIAREVVAVW